MKRREMILDEPELKCEAKIRIMKQELCCRRPLRSMGPSKSLRIVKHRRESQEKENSSEIYLSDMAAVSIGRMKCRVTYAMILWSANVTPDYTLQLSHYLLYCSWNFPFCFELICRFEWNRTHSTFHCAYRFYIDTDVDSEKRTLLNVSSNTICDSSRSPDLLWAAERALKDVIGWQHHLSDIISNIQLSISGGRDEIVSRKNLKKKKNRLFI